MMLGRIGRLCVDSIILQRIIPLLIVALEDHYSLIKVTALKILTALITLVEEFEPIESNYFPLYIFPILSKISRDNELLMRLTFCECIGRLALTAKSFLDRGHALFMHKVIHDAMLNNGGGGGGGGYDLNKIVVEFPYDQKLELLKDQVNRWLRDLILDGSTSGGGAYGSSSSMALTQSKVGGSSSNSKSGSINPAIHNASIVFPFLFTASTVADAMYKKTILRHIKEILLFFGQESIMEKLLPQLLTFQNDSDWELRYLFCLTIPVIASFVGTMITSEFIIPCLENNIYDMEEKVTLATVLSLTTLISLKLITKTVMLELLVKCKPLLLHCSTAIRDATIQLFVFSAKEALGEVITTIRILPELNTICRFPLIFSTLSLTSLKDSLSFPLSRERMKMILLGKLREFAENSQNSQKNPPFLQELLYSAVTPVNYDSQLMERHQGGDAEGGELFPSVSEEEKILFISPYLSNIVKQTFNKFQKWNKSSSLASSSSSSSSNSLFPTLTSSSSKATAAAVISSSRNSNRYASDSSSYHPNLSLLNSLVWTSLPFLDNSIFSFVIPTMKASIYVSEEWRKQNIYCEYDHEGKNQQKIRLLFLGNTTTHASSSSGGGGATAGGSAFASSYNDYDYYDGGMGSPLPGGRTVTTSTNLQMNIMIQQQLLENSQTYYASYKSSTTAINSISLLRRIKALKIPPLAVDMGTLLPMNDERTM
jgi:hypothetical protein